MFSVTKLRKVTAGFLAVKIPMPPESLAATAC